VSRNLKEKMYSNLWRAIGIGIGIEIDQKAAFMFKIGSFDTDPDSDPDSIKMRIAEKCIRCGHPSFIGLHFLMNELRNQARNKSPNAIHNMSPYS